MPAPAAARTSLCFIVWVRLDRKLLLIAPAIVLVFVAAGIAYTARQLQVLRSGSDTWKDRSDFVAAVERAKSRSINARPSDSCGSRCRSKRDGAPRSRRVATSS
jgi:hypothetical protein